MGTPAFGSNGGWERIMLPMMATMANTTATVNFRTKNCFGILLQHVCGNFKWFFAQKKIVKNKIEQRREHNFKRCIVHHIPHKHSLTPHQLQTDQRFRVQWTTIAFLDHVLWTFHIFRNTSMGHVRQIQFHRCARTVLFLFSFPALCTTV